MAKSLKRGVKLTAPNQDFEMHKGDTKTISFEVEGIEIEDINSIKWVAVDSTTNSKLIEKDLSSGIEINGQNILVNLDVADTENLNNRSMIHVLKITDIGSQNIVTHKAAEGHIRLYESIN